MSESSPTLARRTLIELSGADAVSMRHPQTPVVRDIEWTVEEGDFWVVGGLLGSGKTDFLSLAAGLMPPGRGACRLFGQDLSKCDEREQTRQRLRLGKVFDGGQLLHDLTVAENVALPIRYHQDCGMESCAERVHALLEFAGLSEWAGHRPGEISRNWRQRAGLARALALRPELLLLDSPLSGLDPRHSDWWLQRLGDLAVGHALTEGRPLTIVVTSLDLRPWKGLAKQFALIKDGRLIGGRDNAGVADPTEHLLKEML